MKSIIERIFTGFLMKVIPFIICLSIIFTPFSAFAVNTDLVYRDEDIWIDRGKVILCNYDYLGGFVRYITDENEGCFYSFLSFTDWGVDTDSLEKISLGFTIENDVNRYYIQIDKDGLTNSPSKNSLNSIDVYYNFNGTDSKPDRKICVAFKLKNNVDRKLKNRIICEYSCGNGLNYILFDSIYLDMYVPETTKQTTTKKATTTRATTTRTTTTRTTSTRTTTTRRATTARVTTARATTTRATTTRATTTRTTTARAIKESSTKFSGTGTIFHSTTRNNLTQNITTQNSTTNFLNISTSSYSTTRNSTTEYLSNTSPNSKLKNTTKFKDENTDSYVTTRNTATEFPSGDTSSNTTAKNKTTKFSGTGTIVHSKAQSSRANGTSSATKFAGSQNLTQAQEQGSIMEYEYSEAESIMDVTPTAAATENLETARIGMSNHSKLLLIIFVILFAIGIFCVIIGSQNGKKKETEE